MPEDKDFKRLVRARMERTGERYTAARAQLRPNEPSRRPELPGTVVPFDLEGYLLRRRQPREFPREEATFGSRWELTVEAGGRTTGLPTGPVSPSAIADLGRVMGGAAYVAFGVDLSYVAPPETDTESSGPPPRQLSMAALEAVMGADDVFRRTVSGLPSFDRTYGQKSSVSGRPRRTGNDVVLPTRSRTQVFVTDGSAHAFANTPLDPSAWPTEGTGKPWVAYGVVVALEATFPEAKLPASPPPGFTGRRRPAPDVGSTFWEAVRDGFEAGAAAAGMPRWSIMEASLSDPASGARVARHWQPADGYMGDA